MLIRASANSIYFALERLDRDLAVDLAVDLDHNLALYCESEPYLVYALHLDHSLAYALAGTFTLDRVFLLELEVELEQALQQLKDQIPDREAGEVFTLWQRMGEAKNQAWTEEYRAAMIRYKAKDQLWREQLRELMIKYRKIGNDWQFSEQQKELLQQYYYASKLLVDCMNNDCYVSREVRSHIEDTLLLPIAEIEKRRLGD